MILLFLLEINAIDQLCQPFMARVRPVLFSTLASCLDDRPAFSSIQISKAAIFVKLYLEIYLEALTSVTRRLDVPYVFYDPATGKPYQDIKRSFKTACRRVKIRDFRFHDLRHTFASHLVMAGQDITTVKELLGHKTLTMTLRYAHLAPSHKVKAVEVLDSILNDKAPDSAPKETLKVGLGNQSQAD
jgi:hypothetical protein